MGSQAASQNAETAILDRLLTGRAESLPAEAARYLLSLDFGPADLQRMRELAGNAQDGTLNAQQAAEIEGYRRVGHLLALLHSRARLALRPSALPKGQ